MLLPLIAFPLILAVLVWLHPKLLGIVVRMNQRMGVSEPRLEKFIRLQRIFFQVFLLIAGMMYLSVLYFTLARYLRSQ